MDKIVDLELDESGVYISKGNKPIKNHNKNKTVVKMGVKCNKNVEDFFEGVDTALSFFEKSQRRITRAKNKLCG